ncbi:hypothetical protein ES708_07208 [subsurface metagenome]
MREISTELKLRVIKLFLTGLTFDEIAEQLPVSKGSVVSIVADFRNGDLPIPPGMNEYIDELRRLVVDLRKQSTNITQLETYLKLHAKLKEMGIDSDKASQWLDICQELASRSESSRVFAESALELQRLRSETGLPYQSLVQNYNAKVTELRNIEQNIEAKAQALKVLKQKCSDEQKRVDETIASINTAIVFARDSFEKQKKNLQIKLKKYMAKDNLSWQMVREVEAVIGSGLKGAGLTEKDKQGLCEQIRDTGSIHVVTKQLEQKRDKVKSEVGRLILEKGTYLKGIKQLKTSEAVITKNVAIKAKKTIELDGEIKSEQVQLQRLKKEISEKTSDLYICHLILDFLFDCERLTTEDLDRLVSMMLTLRQERLDINPRITEFGGIIYKHELPRIYTDFWTQKPNVNAIREAFAFLLAPLLKDKLVSKYEYDTAISGYKIIREGRVTKFKSINPPAVRSNKPAVIFIPPKNV